MVVNVMICDGMLFYKLYKNIDIWFYNLAMADIMLNRMTIHEMEFLTMSIQSHHVILFLTLQILEVQMISLYMP